MSWFKKTFGDSVDPLLKRADDLVFAAHGSAITLFESMVDRFPKLLEVDLNQWDFCMTVSGVFIATARLATLAIEQDRKKQLLGIVTQKLNEWNPDSLRGVEDCQKLFEREFERLSQKGHAPNVAVVDAVGM